MHNSNIYECINITNVINHLNIKKTSIRGNYIYAICPFCQNSKEKNGYLKINTINNIYICKKCEASGSSIDLFAKLKYVSTKEAYKMLLKEEPILDNIPYVFNNPLKDEYYRDMVYRKLLDMQELSSKHYNKLKEMGFNDSYIEKYMFKSIENNINKKKAICKKLQESGLKLDGIPGMYQDVDFKWTYKSHKGIFIPVISNNRVHGLRILLDNNYNLDTKNIWFSSSNEYNGTKANNWPMILDTNDWFDIYNSKQSKSIIIATEIIIAHKLFNNTNKTVIGVPNNIDKDIILNIIKSRNVNEVFLYADQYTILHTSCFMYENIIETLEKQNVKVHFRIALNENNLGQELEKDCNTYKKIA